MTKNKFTRREILKLGFWGAIGTLASGVASLEYANLIEPSWLHINPVDLTLPRLPKAFESYRLVHISDIHHDFWMTQTRLANIVDAINQTEPDSIVITGDFISKFQDDHKSVLTAELSRLAPKHKTFAVLGNHDHWTDADLVREALQASGITELPNNVYTFEHENSFLHICGVDDYWEGHADIDKVLKKLPDEGCAILLCHEPDYDDISSATGRFDLQLSGHSHGGQVVFPFLPPLVVPPLAEKYPSGLYQVGNMLQYTNRGVGMIQPYVRFNCRPEITVFTLHTL